MLVTGITGSGKSTTLASMIEYMNRTTSRHIITVEDPIEFSYVDDRCVINQREVGIDTRDFRTALRNAMREAPDVILIGEMRDVETVQAAIDAAETGHLVLSTLHTINAQQTMERIINFFPPYQHALIRMQLSMVFQGVISQRLIPRKERAGRVPGLELMIATPTIKQLIEEGRTPELYAAIATASTTAASPSIRACSSSTSGARSPAKMPSPPRIIPMRWRCSSAASSAVPPSR